MEGGRLTIKKKIVCMSRICSGEENQSGDSVNQHAVSV